MNDDWEDEARWEAEQEAAGEAYLETHCREWVRDHAAELAREFFEDNYEEAVQVFTSERLQSFYVQHPDVALPAFDTLNYARSLMPMHPRAALVFGATSTELVIKNVLLRPLISGLVHVEDLALLVVEQSTSKTGLDRFHKILSGILTEFSSFDLSTFQRSGSSQTLWQEIKTIQEVRNGVVHRGETVAEEVARRSMEIADTLLNILLPDILSQLKLHTHPPMTICDKTH
ncbi:MAG TPA: hypothetical protein VFU48_01405 [Nitrospira sp.]|nr:hypothetical protein [Nitrospira sp.]